VLVQVEDAAKTANQGGLVAFPTETVYGLGADATNSAAVSAVYKLKGRPSTNPLIVHSDSGERAIEQCVSLSLASRGVLERMKALSALWPGPLSIVLPKHPRITTTATNGSSLVGIRVPAHPLAQRFLALCNGPIAAPSANRSNRVSPTSAEHVIAEFGLELPLLDGGACALGIESTVVEPRDIGVVIHRPGFITPEQIATLAGPLIVDSEHPIVISPGQSSVHYAPETPCFLPQNLPSGLKHVTLLGLIGAVARLRPLPPTWTAVSFADEIEFAAKLYSTLRAVDSDRRCDAICIVPPEPTGLGLAICDRLSRATRR
jgi:L-threonylcarbamoyladenylate synthase